MRRLPGMLALPLLTFVLTGCPMTDSHSNEQDVPQAPRTTKDIIRDGNHLKDEPSLYLQQHAHNPLDWYPWGEAALAKAKTEDKPIFLSIGYSSCHWCHVMEHEVFEHEDVAAFMNEHFVCIKVDREERPDLDQVYMEAVQMITGRGGWPMSVWLTPDLKPFHGGTYFPKDHFMQLVTQIVEIYGTKREDLENQAAQLAERIEGTPRALAGGDVAIDDKLLAGAVAKGKEIYDPTNAGFRQSQKFPTPIKWRFLLHEYRRKGDEELAGMITATLEAMQGGGIYDHVGGGFHRYTVDARWTVPHFEKMLYDNGQLAGLYLEAGAVFDRPDFTATGTDVLDFLLNDMRDEKGGFYGSYDADSGGEEGTYYVWSPQELIAAVGQHDGAALADLLGVSERGNFEDTGKSVLTRRADVQVVSAKSGRAVEELEALFGQHREKLRSVREVRTPPGLDPKIITSWNGLVITSLAQAYAVTGRGRYLEGARTAADFLLATHRRQDGSLWRTTSDGRPRGEGTLDDYVFLADGLLEIYQVSGMTEYLQAARDLTDFARHEFGREDGGWYLARNTVDKPLGRSVDTFDSVVPSGNAVMLNNLIRLAAITGRSDYRHEAEAALAAWSGLLDKAGLEMAWWFDAAAKLVGPYYDVVIAGDRDDEATGRLVAAVLADLPASAVVSLVPADGPADDLLAIAPALADKKALGGMATAFVCEFGTCQAPTSDIAKVREQLLRGWTR